jgi:hypothetical protein
MINLRVILLFFVHLIWVRGNLVIVLTPYFGEFGLVDAFAGQLWLIIQRHAFCHKGFQSGLMH